MSISIDSILMAVNRLRDNCPRLQISAIKIMTNSMYFETKDGYIYKYDCLSGRIYRSYKANWNPFPPTFL